MPTSRSIEAIVKDQYTRFYTLDDSVAFKTTAEYFLRQATRSKKKELKAESKQAWLRGMQKRLLIGIGCELLLKSYFLMSGFCINKPILAIATKPPYRIQDINLSDFDFSATYSMYNLLEQLPKIGRFNNHNKIMRGFRIARVFRDNEGHAPVYWHMFNPQNYRDIESALTSFYPEAFSQSFKIQFAIQKGEKSIFDVEEMKS